MVWRMISLTCASDSERSIASPIAMATISTAAFSSSVQRRSTHAVVDGERSPQMAVGEDRDRQEGLDLLVLEVLAQEAFDLAGAAGEHLALPDLLGQPAEQRIGIDDRLEDDASAAGDADRPPRPPNRRRSTGRSPCRAVRAAGTGSPGGRRATCASSLEDLVDDALPVRRLAQPPARCARPRPCSPARRCRFGAWQGWVSIMDAASLSAGWRTIAQRPSSGSEKI